MPDLPPGGRIIEWSALVAEFEDLEAQTPAYEFSARTFTETKYSGIYDTSDEE